MGVKFEDIKATARAYPPLACIPVRVHFSILHTTQLAQKYGVLRTIELPNRQLKGYLDMSVANVIE